MRDEGLVGCLGLLLTVAFGAVCVGLVVWNQVTCTSWETRVVDRTSCYHPSQYQTICTTKPVEESICVARD